MMAACAGAADMSTAPAKPVLRLMNAVTDRLSAAVVLNMMIPRLVTQYPPQDSKAQRQSILLKLFAPYELVRPFEVDSFLCSASIRQRGPIHSLCYLLRCMTHDTAEPTPGQR